MSEGYIQLPVLTGGISSINGDSTPAQEIVGSTDISVSTVDGTTTITYTGAAGGVSSVGATAPVMSSGGATPVISITQATTSTNGYLSSTDWNTFNSKQVAGSYITALTGDVTAAGPGSAAATVNSIGGSTASQVNSTVVTVGNATSAATINTLVKRDGTGSFAASSITVPQLYGNSAAGSYSSFPNSGSSEISSTSNSAKGYVGISDNSGFVFGQATAISAAISSVTTALGVPPGMALLAFDYSDPVTADFVSPFTQIAYGASSTVGPVLQTGYDAGTTTSHAYAAANDVIWGLFNWTYSGTSPMDQQVGGIFLEATESQSTGHLGTKWVFAATPTGTNTLTDVLTIGGTTVTIAPTTATTSGTTGALVIGGGIGLAGGIYAGSASTSASNNWVLQYGSSNPVTGFGGYPRIYVSNDADHFGGFGVTPSTTTPLGLFLPNQVLISGDGGSGQNGLFLNGTGTPGIVLGYGSSTLWNVDSSGTFLAYNDGTPDIGATGGANRPGSGYFKTLLEAPLVQGGETASENLILSSTSNNTKGFVGAIDTSILAAGANVIAGLAAYTTAGNFPPAQFYVSNLGTDATASDNSVLIEVWGAEGSNAFALGGTGGTSSSPNYLANNKHVFTIYFTGWNGSTPNDQTLATVSAVTTQDHTSSAFGTEIRITSTPNNGTNDVETAIFAGDSITLGPSGGTGQHTLNTSTATPGSGVGTISNLPAGYSGNPTGYVQITINGGTHVIPYW